MQELKISKSDNAMIANQRWFAEEDGEILFSAPPKPVQSKLCIPWTKCKVCNQHFDSLCRCGCDFKSSEAAVAQ